MPQAFLCGTTWVLAGTEKLLLICRPCFDKSVELLTLSPEIATHNVFPGVILNSAVSARRLWGGNITPINCSSANKDNTKLLYLQLFLSVQHCTRKIPMISRRLNHINPSWCISIRIFSSQLDCDHISKLFFFFNQILGYYQETPNHKKQTRPYFFLA